jgi:hypothetical protein
VSHYYDGLEAIREGILAAGLEGLGIEAGTAGKVLIKKMPKVGEQIDGPLPLILVCPDDVPEEVRPIDFEGGVDITYATEVAIVAAGDQDYAQNLPTYLDWREQIRRRFMFVGPPTGFRSQRVSPGRPLDRGKLSQLYDYQTLTVRLTVREVR